MSLARWRYCGTRLDTFMHGDLRVPPRSLSNPAQKRFWIPVQARFLSESSRPVPDPEFDEKANAVFEHQSKIREARYRLFKKIFSTVLFGSTLGLVYYAHRRRRNELADNLKECIRLPNDINYQGGHSELYRVPSKVTGKPTYVLPSQMVKNGSLKQIQDFQVRPSDIFVASFPKAGTTWIQEIVYLIVNNLDFDKASERVLETRFPYLEYLYPGLNSIASMESTRLIKTHLPYDLLPPKLTDTAKLIYIYRNPKDTTVSYYHFVRMYQMSSYRGSFEDFLHKFKRNEVPYGPYFDHIESYFEHEDDPNLLLISYEELSKNPAETIRRIGIFLDHPLRDDEIQILVGHTNFATMSKNPSVNYSHWDDIGIRNKNEAKFLRKGKIGDWQNYFTPEMNAGFDQWILENNNGRRQFQYEASVLPESVE